MIDMQSTQLLYTIRQNEEHIRIFPYQQYRSVGEGTTPFPGWLHFSLDSCLIFLNVKQDVIE